ncbi:MAG TPA: hypothetical protein DCZ69_10465, partial [Syntrophobacteraceae bacterium]|nr:hypothetical protein [Syntrophobacteraceae bacterium]
MFRPEDLIGKQIDQFRLDRFIARGAMGIVYKAFDTVLARTVALKLISRQVTDGLSTQDINAQEEARKRLIQEAKAAGRLTHPNIITIHSYGESENFDYICMEYVTGKTLTQLLNVRKILPIEEAIPIIEQVLMALDAASREQIVHRDIKPSNIMITEDGRVKVMDFGIAKLPSLSMTTTGTVLGTPYYMSPEQISGQKLDSRSDIFSLGAVMYQVLTGERPFEAENTATLVYKIVQTEPIPAKIRNSSVSESVSNMIIKAMAKNPGQRYQTPREMLQALKAILSPGAGEVREESDATIIASGDEFEMTLQADKAALAPSPMGPGVSEVSTPPREELPPSPSEQKSSDQGAPSGVPGRSTEAQPGKGDTETVKRKGGVGPPAASKPATVTKATTSPPVTTKPKPSLPPKTTGLN